MASIPKKHEKYGLLPRTVNDDTWECFLYPSLYEFDEAGIDGIEPYGYSSVEQYNAMIAHRIAQSNSEETIRMLKKLQEDMTRMNNKENWSVLKFLGEHFPPDYVTGIDKGCCYYWPCDIDDPVYQGVIDNEEYTAYWYPTEPDMWEILEDPTGMAHRTIFEKDEYVSLNQWNEIMGQVRDITSKE